MIVEGKAHTLGDNIDTDAIIPAIYMYTTDPAELARHCLEVVDPDFTEGVEPGDILVCGENFGCGSSREHAPIAIAATGVRCVVVKSCARIFYRNAFNIGLPVLECREAVDAAHEGSQVKVCLEKGEVEVDGRTFAALPIPQFMQAIIDAGGLMNYIAKSEGRRECK